MTKIVLRGIFVITLYFILEINMAKEEWSGEWPVIVAIYVENAENWIKCARLQAGASVPSAA